MGSPKKKHASVSPIMKFAPASGSPLSEADAQVVGQELLKIAQKHAVDGVRSLTKHIVFAEIKANPNHPLWQFCPRRDVEEAAEGYWISWCGALVRQVRVVVVQGDAPVLKPFFVVADTSGVQPRASRRAHVLRDDALKLGPEFASAFGYRIRMIKHACDGLLWCLGGVNGRELPANIRRVYEAIRLALDEYEASLAVDAAAE